MFCLLNCIIYPSSTQSAILPLILTTTEPWLSGTRLRTWVSPCFPRKKTSRLLNGSTLYHPFLWLVELGICFDGFLDDLTLRSPGLGLPGRTGMTSSRRSRWTQWTQWTMRHHWDNGRSCCWWGPQAGLEWHVALPSHFPFFLRLNHQCRVESNIIH